MDRHRPARPHYAWVILAVTCLTVVMTAGVTAVPAVLIHPLEVAFGWDRAAIALAVSINVFLYGLAGPFAGRVMLRVGPRRVMLISLLLLAGGVAASTQVQTLLHLYLLWGVVVGVGTGSTSLVLSATVVNRWFTTQRGLALGLLGAASSTGRLVFLPLLATIVATLGWQAVGWVVAGCLLLIVLPLVALLMRDAPAAMGLTPYGTVHDPASGVSPTAPPPEAPLVSLGGVLRQGNFWRLWLTFAICGATTNGLIGTHLIPHAIDQGLSAVAAATTLAMMGMLDIVGTLGSGWLSDRYDKRVLLAGYYGLRGLSLLYLPYADDLTKLALFGVVYGLDWIATVPPRPAWRQTSSGNAPARSSLAGCSSAIRLARPSRRMAAASSASGWAPITSRLPLPGCWPSALPSSSSPSDRGGGPCRWPPPTRRRPRRHRGLWPSPGWPPDEFPEGTYVCGWHGTFAGLPEEFWVAVTTA